MSDLLSLLAAMQNGGGILVVGVWGLWKLYSLEREFRLHQELYIHNPKPQK